MIKNKNETQSQPEIVFIDINHQLYDRAPSFDLFVVSLFFLLIL